MPAYAYPEPTELVDFRAGNQASSVWEAISQISTDTSLPYYGPVVSNVVISDSSGAVWQLTIDTNGIATTTKLATTPVAPTELNFLTSAGIFQLSVDIDGSLLTTQPA